MRSNTAETLLAYTEVAVYYRSAVIGLRKMLNTDERTLTPTESSHYISMRNKHC